MTTTERILQSSGLESAIGSIQPRELGLTSDTERAVIGTTGGGAKFLRSEDIITVSTAAPAAFGVLRRDKTICFVDTTAAGASVAIDITAGAQVKGYSISFAVIGTAGRNCTVSYGSGLSVVIAYGYSYDFVWTGTDWLPVIVEKLGADTATPRGYIDGLICSNAADADHDITIAAGKARDSADAMTLILASAITKQIDAAWAAGNNAGGMFAGAALAANTTYYIFIIRKDTDGSIDAGFDDDIIGTHVPAGYTYKRMIRRQMTDAASNIIPTDQTGDVVKFKQPIQDRALAALANTNRNAYTITAPPNVLAIVAIFLECSGIAPYYLWYGASSRTDNAASNSNFDLSTKGTGSGTFPASVTDTVLTNATRQFYARGSATQITMDIRTLGWVDDRGRIA